MSLFQFPELSVTIDGTPVPFVFLSKPVPSADKDVPFIFMTVGPGYAPD